MGRGEAPESIWENSLALTNDPTHLELEKRHLN